MTRRDASLLTAASVSATTFSTDSLAAQNQTAQNQTETSKFDPVAYARERHATAPLRLRFAAKSQREAAAWQKQLRAKLTELVGGFPARKTPLNARGFQTVDRGTHTRERFVFTSREGMDVLAYLLKPEGAQGRLPVMLVIPGHGRGVDDTVGLDEKGQEREGKPGYMHDYAIQVVEQQVVKGGVAALALEPLAFGHRRDPINAARGLTANSCQPAAGAALLLGETMIGWRVYDMMRAIDWVATRPDLDAGRVGAMGISGGGTCALFATALDERIRAALVSGYLCTFRDSILSLAHCMDNYVPGILQWAEMSDIASLIAPRALFAESGEQDRIFPVAGFRESVAAVEKAYAVYGAAEHFGHTVHAEGHVFDGRAGLPFVLERLRA
ncbi:MAG: alpha/beta hydrolase family protein [Bryobacter sp.]|nr:alpha/beta hydrolase family protein [Bryobacter sp.]